MTCQSLRELVVQCAEACAEDPLFPLTMAVATMGTKSTADNVAVSEACGARTISIWRLVTCTAARQTWVSTESAKVLAMATTRPTRATKAEAATVATEVAEETSMQSHLLSTIASRAEAEVTTTDLAVGEDSVSPVELMVVVP